MCFSCVIREEEYRCVSLSGLFRPGTSVALVTYWCITNNPPTQQFKTTNIYHLAQFLRVRNLEAAWKWKSLSHVWLYDPMAYTVHGILQVRILEWVAFPFSRGSSQSRDQTQVSHSAGRLFTSWATREALWIRPRGGEIPVAFILWRTDSLSMLSKAPDVKASKYRK